MPDVRDYYNEIDPFAAAWLRALILAGELPPGDVDERSIEDVAPIDLAGYRHCHFFAGIGGWALAMRLAQWPEDVPLWTGSCPCQPFSQAGQGAGFADERHLWPAWEWLIQQRRPRCLTGEQVASPDGRRWWDLVASDLEHADYSCCAFNLPAASVKAPHNRPRLFWLAYNNDTGLVLGARHGEQEEGVDEQSWDDAPGRRATIDADRRMAHAGSTGLQEQRRERHESTRLAAPGCDDLGEAWSDCDWVVCRDPQGDVLRPVEAGTFPLADGIPARVGRIRGYGNAIVPQVAAEVLKAWMEERR